MTGNRLHHRSVRHGLVTVAGIIVGLSLAAPAHAQGAGKGFLFEEPRWTLAIRGGFERANAKGEIFDFVTDELTLERGDFSGLNVSIDLAYSIRPRLDLAFSAGYSGSKAPSESRKYIGTDDLPIYQTTRFVRTPVTASLKAYLAPRGQSIGTLAWIPSRFAPYVGVGGGAVRYMFKQEGEFVDVLSPNLDVFRDELRSEGWTPTAHGLAGLDIALSPRWGVTTEARYSWAKGDMGDDLRDDFVDFGRIDLSGLSATMGLHVRF